MLWQSFKLLLSSLLLSGVVFIGWVLFTRAFDPALLGVASVLLFFAAWPWVDHMRPSRALSLVGLVFSLGAGFVASRTLVGDLAYPRACHGRGRSFCELENLLYELGGPSLAAAPMAAFSLVFFVISCRALIRMRSQGSHT